MLTVFGEVRGPFALGRLRARSSLPSGKAIATARVRDALLELQEAWRAWDAEVKGLRRDEGDSA